MHLNLSPRARLAVDFVRQATRLSATIQTELAVAAIAKADQSPVTVADFAVQAVLSKLLGDTFSAETLVGEEGGNDLLLSENDDTLQQVLKYVRVLLPTATTEGLVGWIERGTAEPTERFWTLDPIDGTKGFLRQEQFAVALAWLEHGVVQLGILGCPRLGTDCLPGGNGVICVAERGRGSWAVALEDEALTSPRRLQASTVSDGTQARLLGSAEAAHTNLDQMGSLATRLATTGRSLGLDSQAKYALLAAGQAELLARFLSPKRPDYRERIWDQAAGSILLEEAGGTITDLDGKRLDFSQGRGLEANRGILATNGPLHPVCLAAIKDLGC